MLARLSQIGGVESSFANEPGSLVRLSLRPGADRRKVAREVERVLSEEAVRRSTVPLRPTAPLAGPETSAALRAERWTDREEVARQAAEIVAAEGHASQSRFLWLLLALLLLCAAGGLWALRRRRRAVAD